ncbi:hypothetical protein Taro_008148 [Colocasia esculenta]|uniref:Uncharacterized protein n=1 Tax=Colocasia esculenta TaxID=4460 RepID=A0A843U656_COLES|nr:hypothetical protein [Colocasia esculenta]
MLQGTRTRRYRLSRSEHDRYCVVISPENAAYRAIAFSELFLVVEWLADMPELAFELVPFRLAVVYGWRPLRVPSRMRLTLGSRGYNQLVDHVGIHGQRRLTEALSKDSLVRQKEYLTEKRDGSIRTGNQNTTVPPVVFRTRQGLELEVQRLELGQAFSPRVLLLLGLLSTPSKPHQRLRAGHGEIGEYLSSLGAAQKLTLAAEVVAAVDDVESDLAQL